MTLSFTKPILRNHTVMLQIYHKNHILIKHVNSCWATSMAILVTCNPEGQVGHADKDFHSCERRLVLSRRVTEGLGAKSMSHRLQKIMKSWLVLRLMIL